MPSYHNYQTFLKEASDAEGAVTGTTGLASQEYTSVHEEVTAKTTVFNYTPKFISLSSIMNPFNPTKSIPNTVTAFTKFTDSMSRFSNLTPSQSGFLQAQKNLGHISYERIRELARQGELPKEYITLTLPACAACMYAKSTKRPWRTKTKNKEKLVTKQQLQPGDCVAVDMLNSPTPGLN